MSSSSVGWVRLSCCLERSGSTPAGWAAWADRRLTGRAAELSFLLGGMCCAAECSGPPASMFPERTETAAAAAAPIPCPGPLLHPCRLPLQGWPPEAACLQLCFGPVDVAVSQKSHASTLQMHSGSLSLLH